MSLDPLDELLELSGVRPSTAPNPSNWVAIERTNEFEAQQVATRQKLAEVYTGEESEYELESLANPDGDSGGWAFKTYYGPIPMSGLSQLIDDYYSQAVDIIYNSNSLFYNWLKDYEVENECLGLMGFVTNEPDPEPFSTMPLVDPNYEPPIDQLIIPKPDPLPVSDHYAATLLKYSNYTQTTTRRLGKFSGIPNC